MDVPFEQTPTGPISTPRPLTPHRPAIHHLQPRPEACVVVVLVADVDPLQDVGIDPTTPKDVTISGR